MTSLDLDALVALETTQQAAEELREEVCAGVATWLSQQSGGMLSLLAECVKAEQEARRWPVLWERLPSGALREKRR